jgi:CO/xanthine dehydrogenase FAD-binding subunit
LAPSSNSGQEAEQVLASESRFQYLTPNSLTEFAELLGKYREQAKICAGGTDLLVQIAQGVFHPTYVVSTSRLDGFDKIELHEDAFKIGSLTTIRTIEKSRIVNQTFPVLAQAAHEVASIQIRNVATLGGNLCQNIKCAEYNQSHIGEFMRESIKPCFKAGGAACIAPFDSIQHVVVEKGICRAPFVSDLGLALYCLDASLTLISEKGERAVPIRKFYRGPSEFDLKEDEFLKQATVPIKGSRLGSGYAKYKQTANGYGVAAAAVSILLEEDNSTCRSATITIGGVATTPYNALEAASLLEGRRVNGEVIEQACGKILESTRHREMTRSFKVSVARSLVKSALEKAVMRGVEVN